MLKNCFVGAGLSAYFSQLLYWREGDVCMYPSASFSPYVTRRPELEINKLFSSHASSLGSNAYNLAHGSLHDRPTIGGNSEIWGGFFDAAKVRQLDKLTEAGIHSVPLSYQATGSISNVKSLVQLQSPVGKILNVSQHLRPGIRSYLDSITFKQGLINLQCLSEQESQKTEIAVAGKVFVCTGVTQTIDLLIRSQLIKPGDTLTLDEFEYELVLGGNLMDRIDEKASVISFTPGRAAAHWVGMQQTLSLPVFKPFVIHQIFHPRKQTLRMVVTDQGCVRDDAICVDGNPKNFGKSIHYCNLKINGKTLVDLASRWSLNLHFVSMASVSQTKPGPISSDIFGYLESIRNEL